MSERPVTLLTAAERAGLDAARAAAALPWYEALISPFVAGQEANRAHLEAAAACYRAIDRHLEGLRLEFARLADVAAALAESVPSGDQAAADLGTAAERHEVDGLRGVLLGEQQLRERDLAALGARLAAIEAQLARADRQRTLILQALGATEGGA